MEAGVCAGLAATHSTETNNRYPRRATVSIYFGLSAASPSACRNFLIAVWMLWSNSTTVSFGQSLFLISSRVTTSPRCSTSIRRIWKGCS